tara:strand:- start:3844 stop:4290 length:447 start_codon:yes stop_codon:yes gene_type:complete
MDRDRHHLLELFEKIHDEYNLKEIDYKTFLEALGGKRQVSQVPDEAKFVEIVYDEFSVMYDYDSLTTDESPDRVMSQLGNKKILKVVDTESAHNHCAICRFESFTSNKTTSIPRDQLNKMIHESNKPNAEIEMKSGELIFIKSVKVLG